jgi:phosphoserine phosphatase RsbU/P
MAAPSASLIVVTPTGDRSRLRLTPLPFGIGRLAGNQLVLRDTRISRNHARIVLDGNDYWIEDLASSHGLFVNGVSVSRQRLSDADRIDFGLPDSYHLVFTLQDDEIHRLLDQIAVPAVSATPGTANLAKLRSLVEVARALETSLSTEDVLSAVVDAALRITDSERGFLLLRHGDTLDVRVARDRRGGSLAASDLRVPRHLIEHALAHRRELLAMDFSPDAGMPVRPELTVADLDLRGVVCVPLVRVHSGSTDQTRQLSSLSETVGLLYLDSRLKPADLSLGNRELLQTLALEASTVLENARLLEEARAAQRMEEELKIARRIQASLLPRDLPDSGWFRACGSSLPSYQVGGDYFDVRCLHPSCWSAVLADVSGKGVSSALLASFLQGAFMTASESPLLMEELLARVNHYLIERTQSEKYATAFFCSLEQSGLLRWINAGHCPPLLVGPDSSLRRLAANGLPLGTFEDATYSSETTQLEPGAKLVIYSDGLSDSQNTDEEFFTHQRVRQVVQANAARSSAKIHAALRQAVEAWSVGAVQSDDITLLVIEYQPQ